MRARAVVMHEFGGLDVLRVEEVDVPAPGHDEVRVLIKAIGLNRSDSMYREGVHAAHATLPSRIGVEAAGIVESVGADVTDLAVGDAVSFLPSLEIYALGAYSEAITLPARLVVRNPPELSMAEAASLWSSYMAAYGGLVDLVDIKPDDDVLITAASSSVGLPAIQILNMLGARPIAVTRRREKAEAISALGVKDLIVTDEEDLRERVNALTGGKGVELVFDPVGGPMIATLTDVTAPYGTIVIYGVMDYTPAPLPMLELLIKNLDVRGFANYLGHRPERDRRSIAFIRDGVARGILKPVVGRTFAFDDIVEAARYLDSMEQIGKVVVELP